MKLLFVHQNMPGQYREMIRYLAAQGTHQIVFLTQRKGVKLKGVHVRTYTPGHSANDDSFALSRHWENSVATGFSAAEAARRLEANEGFKPDIVIGHAGWGELTFFKEVWPDVPIIGLFEYYYATTHGMAGFDPEEPASAHSNYFAHARNAVACINIETVDLGHCPTVWQRDGHPTRFHGKLYVAHDGIRTDALRPNDKARLELSRLGLPLTPGDEVVTFVARNLERARGFHRFMRALPKILADRPNARVLIVGGDETSYGRDLGKPGALRQDMQNELAEQLDWDRVHFLGKVTYNDLCRVMQISSCHVYMSMPFVLSWSLLEAMSMGAVCVCSDVDPNREVVTHGENGLLVDYFDENALADQVVDVLANPAGYADVAHAAREQVVQKYDFLTKCLPQHLNQMNALLPSGKQIPNPDYGFTIGLAS